MLTVIFLCPDQSVNAGVTPHAAMSSGNVLSRRTWSSDIPIVLKPGSVAAVRRPYGDRTRRSDGCASIQAIFTSCSHENTH